MESVNDRIKRLEFQQSLLLRIIGQTQYPFYKLIIEKNLTEEEMTELLDLCTELNTKYEKVKEEGFVHFTFLLTHFVGMLNPKLEPFEVVEAMYEQKMYAPLMKEFMKLLDEEK